MSAEAKQPQGLVPGRIVHYVPKERENLREHIVDVWPAMILFAHERVSGNPIRCDLSVNRGGSQDYLHSIAYNAYGAPGTWHWMFEGQEKGYRSEPPSEMPKMKPQDVEPLQKMGPGGEWHSARAAMETDKIQAAAFHYVDPDQHAKDQKLISKLCELLLTTLGPARPEWARPQQEKKP